MGDDNGKPDWKNFLLTVLIARLSKAHGFRADNLDKLDVPPKDIEDLTAWLSRKYGFPSVDLDGFDIPPEILSIVPRDLAVVHRCLPVSCCVDRLGRHLVLALADPQDREAIEAVKTATGCQVDPVIADEASIARAIARYYPE